MVTCDPPRDLAEGSFSPIQDIYKYEDFVQYTCIKDYVLNGSKVASCSADRQFKPDPPVCVSECCLRTHLPIFQDNQKSDYFFFPAEVNCVEIKVENAEVLSGARPPYGHMAFVTLQCNSGYKMVGSPTVTCDINSHWSPKLPTCQRKSFHGPEWKGISHRNGSFYSIIDACSLLGHLCVFGKPISLLMVAPSGPPLTEDWW